MLAENYFDRKIGLSLFRVIAALLILRNLIGYLPYAEDFFGGNGFFPYSRYVQALIHDHVMFLKFPFLIPFMSKVYLIIGIVLSCFLLFGIFSRLTCLLLFVFLVNLQLRNPFIFDGSDNVIQVTLPFLALADSFHYFTFGVFRIRFPNVYVATVLSQIKKYALIGFLIQICMIYLFTGIGKIHSDLWFNGTATYYALRTNRYMAGSLNYLLTENLYFVVINTYLILLFEISFGFLIWFRKTKWLLISFGIIFHTGIWFFMKIDVFPWIMIASYGVFITDEQYGRMYARMLSFRSRFIDLRFRR